MSHEPNFVSELVQMARAFEELPQVKAELEAAKHDAEVAKQRIQALELRLIDRANELDAAHSATRKAEVERDHAETMFLETDQKLDTLRSIISHFKGEVMAFDLASEPEPVAQPKAEEGASVADPIVPTESVTESSVSDVNETGQTEASQTPLPPAGLPAQPSPATPETSTDTALNTTSPGEVGSSGNTASLPPLDAEVRDSVDPTAVNAEQGSTEAQTVAVTSAEPTQDDVGYHNEPKGDEQDWYIRWTAWSDRMNARYGHGSWPARYAV